MDGLVVEDPDEGRYSRLELISWWDQDLLRNAKVMVVGAGALGNEIIKNLTLLGVGNILLIDLDRIELSNLSRSVLFKAEDEGRFKAKTAAEAAVAINPDIRVQPVSGNILHDLGLGAFRAMDVVICGLDNREARLWVNHCCWRVNRPWVDGAIEALNGVARVFVPPDGSCYECTMNETDYKLLNRRKSCALLTRSQMLEGKVPTTPTVASVIAGIQCQEAVKLLHNRPDLPTLKGKGFFFNGLTHDSFVVTYPRKDDCMSHETFSDIIETDWKADRVTIREVMQRIWKDLGEGAVLEFTREIVSGLYCERCGTNEPVYKMLGRITEGEARCPKCTEIRSPDITHTVDGSEGFLDKTFTEIGNPPFDIIKGRNDSREMYYEFSGDREVVLGMQVLTAD